jgi:protein transport protein SEC31
MLASGTVAGALDESFSSESQLEIWAPDFMDKEVRISTLCFT